VINVLKEANFRDEDLFRAFFSKIKDEIRGRAVEKR